MKTIALVSQKGGVGKSTLAVNLAQVMATPRYGSVILDLDVQASSAAWGALRKRDEPVVFTPTLPDVGPLLKRLNESGMAYAVVDTVSSVRASAEVAAKHADVLLIPCRPGLFDFRAIARTIELAQRHRVRCIVILTGVPARSTLATEARMAIKRAYPGVEVAPCTIGQRLAYVHALAGGMSVVEFDPRGKAASEILALCRFLKTRVLKGIAEDE